jgi:hypothetical protein
MSFKKFLPFITVLVLLTHHLNVMAVVYETVSSGSWTSVSIWKGGIVPRANTNNSTIRINEGHNVTFNANAASHVVGQNNTLDVLGNLTISGWGTFQVGNNATINVHGTLTIPSNNKFSAGNNAQVNVVGEFNNNTNSTFGNKTTIAIYPDGKLTNTQFIELGSNSEIIIQGRLINQNYKMQVGNASGITVAETGSLINRTLFEVGDQSEMLIKGLFENTGWKYSVGSNSEVIISETGSLTSKSNLRFGENLFMSVDGNLVVDGWAFFMARNSEMIIHGKMEVMNGHVFQSANIENVVYACEGAINNPDNLKNVTLIDCVPMPVELLYFEAKYNNECIELKWASAAETNSNYFLIEKSYNGYSWEEVAFITSAGNSNHLVEYFYNDEDVSPGIWYYRLKQVDFDGAFEFFSPVAVEVFASDEFKIESITQHGHNMLIKADLQAGAQLMVFDLMGNILFTELLLGNLQSISFPNPKELGFVIVTYVHPIQGIFSSSKYFVN